MNPVSVRLSRLTARAPWIADLAILPLIIVLVLVFALFNGSMLSPTNISNVLSQSSVTAIAAIGATFVILTAGIDLSVGSTLSAAGVAGAAVLVWTGNVPLGILAAVLVGSAVGFILGNLIARVPLIPFVVTLAGLFSVSGVTLLATSGATIAPVPLALTIFSISTLAGVPYIAIVALLLAAIAQFALTRTSWGRRVILVGANERAAVVSGINTKRVLVSVYVIAGVFSGIAGILLTAQLSGANASMGSPLLLNVIGAVVLGGTSLFGGRGSVIRTILGALLLGFLANGMSIIGLETFDQQAVTGIVILVAAGVDALLHRAMR